MSDSLSIDFLVIGAYKSATTTLQAHLAAHPEVYVPTRKEPNYFAFALDAADGAQEDRPNPARERAVWTWTEYESLFDARRSELVAGEVSPEYLPSPLAAARIHDRLPGVRLIVILRNPIERAYSDYLMYVRDGYEKDDFLTALGHQDQRRQVGDPTGDYVANGRYAEQLRRFYDQFPASQILVMRTEDLQGDHGAALSGLHTFLGVGDRPLAIDERNVSGVPQNTVTRWAFAAKSRLRRVAGGKVPRSLVHRVDRVLNRGLAKPPMPDDARAFLADAYQQDLADLELLTGLDLSDWRVLPG